MADAADDIFLPEEIKNDDWYHRENQHCHKTAEVGLTVRARHRELNRDGNGASVAAEDQIGEKIVVPDPHSVEDADGDDRGGE